MQTKQSATTRPLRSASLWATLCATLALTACAGLGFNTQENQVRQRANERWQALMAGDFNRAYGYSTAGFKSIVTPEAYRGRFGASVKWVGNEVIGVNCPEAAKCIANVRVDYKPLVDKEYGETYSTHVDETWLLEEGNWSLFQPIKSN